VAISTGINYLTDGRMKKITKFNRDAESKVYSQHGEDGLLDDIFYQLEIKRSRHFIEIGVGDGTENNTRLLAERRGWKGIWIDKRTPAHIPEGVKFVKEEVKFSNVERIIHGVSKRTHWNLLSLDIDGNDYWVLKSLLPAFTFDVIILEYNGNLPPRPNISIKYNPDFRWDGYSDYFGASLGAFWELAILHGMELFRCDSSGTNAIFVSLENIHPDLTISPVRGWVPLHTRFPVGKGEWRKV
jgi:hypothetical protein